jgi:hypothetical protein
VPTVQYEFFKLGEDKDIIDGLNNNLPRYSKEMDSYIA